MRNLKTFLLKVFCECLMTCIIKFRGNTDILLLEFAIDYDSGCEMYLLAKNSEYIR